MGVSPMPSSADTCKELRLCRCPGSESSHYSLHEEMVAKVRFKDAEGGVGNIQFHGAGEPSCGT